VAPVADLVELTFHFFACSPKTALIARVSLNRWRASRSRERYILEFLGLESPASLSARFHGRVGRLRHPAPEPSGDTHSPVGAVTNYLGVNGGAAVECVLQLLQDQDSGALSHHESIARRVEGPGRGFRLSLRSDSAFMLANPPIAIGVTVASAPPVIMTSAITVLDCSECITYCVSTSRAADTVA